MKSANVRDAGMRSGKFFNYQPKRSGKLMHTRSAVKRGRRRNPVTIIVGMMCKFKPTDVDKSVDAIVIYLAHAPNKEEQMKTAVKDIENFVAVLQQINIPELHIAPIDNNVH